MDDKLTISLCMIVKNGEATIRTCLESIKDLVDEIIIVDSGSTDKTKEIVKEYTDKIYDFIWVDDFAIARNYSYNLATQDYILWLDADDIILEVDQERFKNFKDTFDTNIDTVLMKYDYSRDSNGNVLLRFFRNRLTKRSKNFKWIAPIHEYLEVNSNSMTSDIVVTHNRQNISQGNRNLLIYEAQVKNGIEFTARDLCYYGNELSDNNKYEEAITIYERYLNREDIWIEDAISVCNKLAMCYLKLNNINKHLESLSRSFKYDSPRAEACCSIGKYYLNKTDYEQAIFWYLKVINLKPLLGCIGKIDPACWTWVPHLQLCMCYDRLGLYELAKRHNELAAEFDPNNPSVIHNRSYFRDLLEVK